MNPTCPICGRPLPRPDCRPSPRFVRRAAVLAMTGWSAVYLRKLVDSGMLAGRGRPGEWDWFDVADVRKLMEAAR